MYSSSKHTVDDKIPRPPKISMTASEGIASQLAKVREYQKGQGYGAELDSTRVAPQVGAEPVYNVVRRPGQEPELLIVAGETLAQQATRKAEYDTLKAEYDKQLRLNIDDQNRWDRLIASHESKKDRLEKFQKAHDLGVGQLSTFFGEFQFNKVQEHVDFKATPTLYSAYAVVEKLFMNMDNSGKLMHMFCNLTYTPLYY